jgi:hypothetical protein
MRGVNKLSWAVVLTGAASLAGAADVIYDSKGFEEFEGFIFDDEEQDGWTSTGVFPITWSGPPSKGEKSIMLRVFMAEHELSGMERDTADLLAAGYLRMTISFDIYRPRPAADWFPVLEWGLRDQGNPSFGGQWPLDAPLTSRTYPFLDEYDPFTNDPSVDTVVDTWATLQLRWDFQAGMAFGYYDGVLVTEKPIEDFDSFGGFWIVGQHGGGTPDLFTTEYVWIDNFVITADRGECYPDCDGSAGLDLFDFLCFVNAFDAGDPYADCEANGVTDLFDFLCFVNAFNEGC